MIAFNLIRCLMRRAPAEVEEPVWHVDFKGALDRVVASHGSCGIHAGKSLVR